MYRNRHRPAAPASNAAACSVSIEPQLTVFFSWAHCLLQLVRVRYVHDDVVFGPHAHDVFARRRKFVSSACPCRVSIDSG